MKIASPRGGPAVGSVLKHADIFCSEVVTTLLQRQVQNMKKETNDVLTFTIICDPCMERRLDSDTSPVPVLAHSPA